MVTKGLLAMPKGTVGTLEHVLEVCDHALALAGYTILDGDDECFFLKHENNYYEVKVMDSDYS